MNQHYAMIELLGPGLLRPNAGGCVAHDDKVREDGSKHAHRTGSALAGALWSRYNQWLQERKAIRELSALDDRLLRDIGVERTGIRRLVKSASADVGGPATARRRVLLAA